jgi:phosphopantetheinyl transferase
MPDHERTVWITRLWCAKEAFGKRLGTGVTGGPQRFEARALDSDASLALRDTASGAEARVVTVRSGDWIIAADLGAAHPTLD